MRPRNGAPLRSKPRPNIWHLHRASETGGWIWKVADTRLIGRDVQALARSFFCEGDWHGDCSTRPTGAVKWHPRGEIPSMDLGTGSSHLPLHCDLPGPSAIHPALTNRRGKQTQPRRQPPTFFPSNAAPEPLKAKSPHRSEMTPTCLPGCYPSTGKERDLYKPSRLLCTAFSSLPSAVAADFPFRLLSYCAGHDLFETLSMKTAVTGVGPEKCISKAFTVFVHCQKASYSHSHSHSHEST